MRLTIRTVNLVKNYIFVVENNLQTQSFSQSSFSIKELKKIRGGPLWGYSQTLKTKSIWNLKKYNHSLFFNLNYMFYKANKT